jgi:hypothetical protein
LNISGVFLLSDDQITQFKEQMAQKKWQPLPIDLDIRSKKAWQDLPVALEARFGNYLCETAGDEVLHATQTKSCAEATPQFDIILGILDNTARQLYIVVRAGY